MIREMVINTMESMRMDVGFDRPRNWDEILGYIIEDVEETAGDMPSTNDIAIAFRRLLETLEIS